MIGPEESARWALDEIGWAGEHFPSPRSIHALVAANDDLVLREGPVSYFFRMDGVSVVTLERDLSEEQRQWVLWEEVSHHYQCRVDSGRQLVASGRGCPQRLVLQNDARCESWALKWVRCVLLPRALFVEYVAEGVECIASLAGVPEEMVQARLGDL